MRRDQVSLLDKFFEIVLTEYKAFLPEKLQAEISKASMIKVRNQLSKNLEAFGWVEEKKDTFMIKRPSLTPEWFVFTLYMYFEYDHISAKDVYHSKIYKRFLLNEYDIEYLIAGAKVKGLLETDLYQQKDINTLKKRVISLESDMQAVKQRYSVIAGLTGLVVLVLIIEMVLSH